MTALLAIDVGTLSARAGLLDSSGRVLAAASAPFPLLRPSERQAVYRMDDIWRAVGEAVRACLARTAERPVTLAFDATSSVVLGHMGAPPLAGEADVLCWMDHRGEAEADEIDRSGDTVLDAFGGSMSPEMHLPKLLWLARHDPAAWARVTAVRDLCDELAWRATGTDAHSLNGLACKWPYLPGEGWRHALLDQLGVGGLPGFGALGQEPRPVGALHGRLVPEVASTWGLPPGLPVATGLIDAEAGMLGVLGRGYAGRMDGTLALIAGTSTCLMAMTRGRRLVPGVWGPFRDALLPGAWLHEAGQSFTGAALDWMLQHHPGGPGAASPEGHAAAVADVLALLDAEGPAFAARRHLVPDWLGNRAPLGDGRVRAVLAGVGEDRGRRDFLEAYYATARAVALQVRHIIEHMNQHGYAIRRVALAGGHRHNPLMVRLYADALPAELVLSEHEEPVLLGGAMVGAVTAGLHPDLAAALEAMAPAQHVLPARPGWAAAHDIAYRAYLRLFELRGTLEADAAALERMARPGAANIAAPA